MLIIKSSKVVHILDLKMSCSSLPLDWAMSAMQCKVSFLSDNVRIITFAMYLYARKEDKLRAMSSRPGQVGHLQARKAFCIYFVQHGHARSEEELHGMFSKFGPVARLVLPPSHALALVDFNEPQDARAAFKVRPHVIYY